MIPMAAAACYSNILKNYFAVRNRASVIAIKPTATEFAKENVQLFTIYKQDSDDETQLELIFGWIYYLIENVKNTLK